MIKRYNRFVKKHSKIIEKINLTIIGALIIFVFILIINHWVVYFSQPVYAQTARQINVIFSTGHLGDPPLASGFTTAPATYIFGSKLSQSPDNPFGVSSTNQSIRSIVIDHSVSIDQVIRLTIDKNANDNFVDYPDKIIYTNALNVEITFTKQTLISQTQISYTTLLEQDGVSVIGSDNFTDGTVYNFTFVEYLIPSIPLEPSDPVIPPVPTTAITQLDAEKTFSFVAFLSYLFSALLFIFMFKYLFNRKSTIN